MEEIKLKQTRKHDDDGKFHFEEMIDSKLENIKKIHEVLKGHEYVINMGITYSLPNIVHNLCVANPEGSAMLVKPIKSMANYLLYRIKNKVFKFSKEKKMLSLIVDSYSKMLECEDCVCDHSYAISNLIKIKERIPTDNKLSDFEKSLVEEIKKFNRKSIEETENELNGFTKLRGNNKGKQEKA